MIISIAKLKRFFKRTKQKDLGISLARSQQNWYAMLIGATCVVLIGGTVASYKFFDVRSAESAVIIDPVETTRYRAVDIEKALQRYDARKKEFDELKDMPALTPSVMKNVVDTPPLVASTTDLRVE